MPQILVAGDNQDAYSICEAIEQISEPRGLLVVFCATPQEVLGAVGRGGVAAAVLNFEKAGLTNFELAYRIRESGEGRSTALLLPEVDALGDVEGTLGKQVAIFAFPVDLTVIRALACRLLDAAASGHPATHPLTAKAAVPAATKPAGPASPPGPEALRQQPQRAESVAPVPSRKSVALREESSTRARRVRHRTWLEVRSPHREPPVEPEAEDRDDDDDEEDPAPVARRQARGSASPKRRLLVVLCAVVVLAGLAYGAIRFLRPAAGDAPAATQGGLVATMCVACDTREDRRVQDIHELRCRTCGGKLGFAFHCNDCKKDFGSVPPEKVKTLGDLTAKPECAKCKSWNATALQPAAPAAAEPVKKAAPAAAEPAKKAAPAAAEPARKASSAPAKAAAKPSKPAKAATLDE